MTRPPLEVADILAAHADALVDRSSESMSPAKQKILRRLIACRTATLGAHAQRCDQCDYERIAYNSCRDRHCPKCQAAARAEWLDAQEARLLPTPYFHVVFTVPERIAEVAYQNKKIVYDILMRASAQTLQAIARDPKHLGAKIGLLSVLHTWGQNLLHHPHVHCVVTGGGLSPDGKRWIASSSKYLLPVQVLSSVFRGRFVDLLRRAFRDGLLSFQGALAPLNDSRAFEALLVSAYKVPWVVYAKKPFGGPRQVLRYLARYTHRVAISNSRLLSHENARVSFRWKDYREGHRWKVMTLGALEFIRRFLLHVLPKRFHRIRHYGFLANRSNDFERCQDLLDVHRPHIPTAQALAPEDLEDRCPKCRRGRLHTTLIPSDQLERHSSTPRLIRRPSIGTPFSRSPPVVNIPG